MSEFPERDREAAAVAELREKVGRLDNGAHVRVVGLKPSTARTLLELADRYLGFA